MLSLFWASYLYTSIISRILQFLGNTLLLLFPEFLKISTHCLYHTRTDTCCAALIDLAQLYIVFYSIILCLLYYIYIYIYIQYSYCDVWISVVSPMLTVPARWGGRRSGATGSLLGIFICCKVHALGFYRALFGFKSLVGFHRVFLTCCSIIVLTQQDQKKILSVVTIGSQDNDALGLRPFLRLPRRLRNKGSSSTTSFWPLDVSLL